MKVGNISNFKGATGARGGKRAGAGSKLGQKKKKTLEREIVAEELRQRTLKVANPLWEAQYSLASGQRFLYRIPRVQKESGKIVEGKGILVTDPEEIRAYLDGELQPTASEYYMITTKEPDNGAIIDMMNRTFGKPKETIEHQGEQVLKLDF